MTALSAIDSRAYPRHSFHPIPVIPIWRGFQPNCWSPDHPISRSPDFSVSPCLRGGCSVLPFRSRRCRAITPSRRLTHPLCPPGFHPNSSQAIPASSVPIPLRSSHPIPVIPIWRGFQRLFPISVIRVDQW